MDITSDALTALTAWASMLDRCEIEPMPRATNPLWRVEVDGRTPFVLKQLPQYPPGVAPAEEFRVLCHLERSGVPVALPIVTDEGSIHTTVDDRRWSLLPYLPHAFAFDDAETAYAIGAAIGLLDRALATYPWPVRSFVDDPGRVLGELLPTIPEVAGVVAPVLDRLTQATRDLPVQLTHGDCNAGNVLVDQGRVTGIIDLDHLPTGPRVRDLAYYLASQLDTDVPETLLRVSSTAASCVDGYHSTYPLTEHELDAIVPLMLIVKIGGAHWAVHGWEPDPESYRRNLDAVVWITEHLDALNTGSTQAYDPSGRLAG